MLEYNALYVNLALQIEGGRCMAIHFIQKQIKKNQKEENRILYAKAGIVRRNIEPTLDILKKKIPKSLEMKISLLFEKAFYTVFEKGTSIIEKTYRKNQITVEQIVNEFMVTEYPSRRNVNKMNKTARKSRKWGKRIAFFEGLGLGVLGIGLPDIPLFTAVLLKGIYEVALSYGVDYRRYEEKIYILKLIQAALAQGKEKLVLSHQLDDMGTKIDLKVWNGSLETEIKLAAKSLSDELLLAKFIQGLPVVGVAGAAFNYSTYKKISDYAIVKYKKRFYQRKENEYYLEIP